MKVVAWAVDWPPNILVGAHIATERQLANLAARGHDVTVLTMERRPERSHHGLRIIPDNVALRREVKAADVVISHVGDGHKAHRVALREGKPSVAMLHGLYTSPLDRLYRNDGPPDLIIAPSHALAEAMPWTGETKVCIPVTPGRFYRSGPGQRITIINTSPEKGIETFKKVVQWLPDHDFLAVQGSYGSQRTVTGTNVRWLPRQVDMRRVYASTRVLLMPSIRESWGMVGVEASCSGIPIIAHPCDGIVEALGDSATYIDRDDTASWVEAIRELDEPAVWHDASARARARYEELEPDMTASLESFADAIEDIAR